jgi:hypothetical protein
VLIAGYIWAPETFSSSFAIREDVPEEVLE